MFNYAGLQSSAKSLVDKFGSNWTHRQVTGGSYDPNTDTRSGDITTNTIVKAVEVSYNDNQIDGEVIVRGDVKLLVEALTVSSITPEDKMLNGSDVWQVVNVKKINPGGTNLLYELQVRR